MRTLVVVENAHRTDQFFLKGQVGCDGQIIDRRLQAYGFFQAFLCALEIFHIEIFVGHDISLGNVAFKKKLSACLEIDAGQQRKQKKRGYEQTKCPAAAVMALENMIETEESRLSIVCFRQCHRR